jgi:serine/threonine-protein kinase
MSLAPGTRIGPYEVTAQLGAGGMGEVYRAKDTRLNRTVAIKALQSAGATDPDRISRFEREAQLLASLNHSNIGGIHGLEQSAGAAYLVLEFIDGRPLDSIIREGGAVAAPDAVVIARQIADAIAAAHEKGIIHRDLKPANVMVTADGHVKVLDFGLGKAIGDESGAGSNTSNSPTMTIGGTQAGLILGTAGYMSPEQAKGRTADRRSDVWSFGCVLFEMLAGSRAFEGEDVTDTIAAIVRGEPNWSALPPSTPAALRTLVERCLIKDRTQRLADMAVVRYALGETVSSQVLGSSGPQVLGSSGSRVRARWPLLATVAVLSIAATAAVMRYWSGAPPVATTARPLARFTVVLPDGDGVAFTNMAPLAISPDGTLLAYAGVRAGKIQLFVHDFSSAETRALEGTEGARSPFFNTDGRWIGFFANGKLKKITVGGTTLREIAEAPDARGGSWGVDDNIYFAPTNTSGLWKVPAGGGAATQLTTLDPAAAEISHRNPYALPDGKALLFMVWTGPGSDEHRIEYLSIADGRRQLVVRNADGPITVAGGRIVYAGRQDSLLSAPWNPARPSLEGVEPQVLPFRAQLDNEGAAAFAGSEDGTFVHLLGADNRRLARVVWIDRAGKTEPLPLPERDYVSAAISPDGTRAAIHNRGGTEEIWIFDFRTKSFTPLATTGGSSQAPVWTIDSKSIVYRGTRKGSRNLFIRAADGSGEEQRLTTRAGGIQTPVCVTPDGKFVIFVESGPHAKAGASDLLKVALEGAHEITPVVATDAPETAGQVSPDGRWIAFDLPVNGLFEIWVKPFDSSATSGAMRQISRNGGTGIRWSRDGRELFYTVPNGMMAITVNGDAFSQPRLLFEGRYRVASNANSNYDVAKDGRFLHVQPVQPTIVPNRVEVVLNGIAK